MSFQIWLLLKVKVIIIPDIESINYGRGVGYEIIEHQPPKEIGKISATDINREKLYQMTRDLYKIVFINHFAGIPKINERTLRHFIIAKGLNPKKYESLIICSQKHYQSIKSNNYPNNKIINIDGVNFLFV